MAVNRTPVLKRCRTLGLEPMYLGYDKKSNRTSARAGKKVSEYGTQLRETTEFLYQSGAKEVHIRPACPPLLYACKYLNFSRSTSEMDLITRRVIKEMEGDNKYVNLDAYSNPETPEFQAMVSRIGEQLNFTSLRYNRLDDMIDSVGIDRSKLCTYCWDGKE